MDTEKIIAILKKYRSGFRVLLGVYNHLPFLNSFRGKLKKEIGIARLNQCRIVSSGTGNRLVIGDLTRLHHCEMYIGGSNNTIVIGERCYLNHVVFCMEGDGNTIEIGNHTGLYGRAELAAIEGTAISIGGNCMFSSDVYMRTGDSHSVLRKGTRERMNPSKSIRIGRHVWIGTKVTVLKGAQIPQDCIVGAGSLLTHAFEHPNCVIAGVPAKEVKQDVDWTDQRL